jgi:hypothetical protein
MVVISEKRKNTDDRIGPAASVRFGAIIAIIFKLFKKNQ